MNKKPLVFLIILTILLMSFVPKYNAYETSGDTVYESNQHFNLTATPHTLYNEGWVTFTFTLYNEAYNNTDLDGFWVFNRSDCRPTKTNYTGDFIHKTINYQGWTDLYAIKNVTVQTNKTYRVSAFIDVEFNSSGKYCFGIKKSSVSWQDAFLNGEGDSDGYFWIDPWWQSNYTYSRRITIDSSQVPSDQTNFPVCINLSSDASLAANAQADGDDIAFLNATNETQYNHEIELFDGGTGRLVAWVNITDLNSSSDTILWMYYGNPLANNQQDIFGTWDDGYVLVLHMNDYTNAQVNDSTSNVNHGTKDGANTPIQTSTSMLGFAQDFSGNAAADRIDVDDDASLKLVTHSTFEFWVSFDLGFSATGQGGNNQDVDLFNKNDYAVRFDEGDGGRVKEQYGGWQCDGASGLTAWSANVWYYVVFVNERDGDDVFEYVNDILQETDANGDNALVDTDHLFIGDNAGHNVRQLNGKIDEFRISDVARSRDWLLITYASIYNATNGSFFTIESAIEYNALPEITNPIPADTSTNNVLTPIMNITVNEPTGETMNITWYSNSSGAWLSFGTNLSVNNGTYYQTNSNFSCYDSTYWWNVSVNDGTDTNDSDIFHFTTRSSEITMNNENPSNGTVDFMFFNVTYQNFTILINNTAGDNFAYINISLSNDTKTSYHNYSTVGNGTYWLNWSSDLEDGFLNLSYSTLYTWYVNTSISDGCGIKNHSWFTFTTTATDLDAQIAYLIWLVSNQEMGGGGGDIISTPGFETITLFFCCFCLSVYILYRKKQQSNNNRK